MIWHVQQKVVKCYFVLLPGLSYLYWLIHFKLIFRILRLNAKIKIVLELNIL